MSDIEHIDMEWAYAWGAPSATAILRSCAEDFVVEEIPLQPPEGEGEHQLLVVKKRHANSEWVARQLALFAGVDKLDVGYAGLKDRNAVTTQGFSVKVTGCEAEPDWGALAVEGVEVVSVARTRRKLKRGMLAGNRFEIRLQGVVDEEASLESRLQQIQQQGVPNYFGPQRFGHAGNNLHEALRMFQRHSKVKDRHQRGLYLSAVRSYLFNQTLSARVMRGDWDQLLEGECAWTSTDQRGTLFDPHNETHMGLQQRGELIATGPLWGDGRLQCGGVALALEQQVAAAQPIWLEGLKAARMAPMRRPLRLQPSDLEWRMEGPQTVWIGFQLPAGGYATAVLRELIRC